MISTLILLLAPLTINEKWPFFGQTRAFKNMRIDGLVSEKISACSRRVDFFKKRVEILLNRRLSMPCYLCTQIVKIFVDSQNVP